MNKKWLPHIFAVFAFAIFIVLGLASATTNTYEDSFLYSEVINRYQKTTNFSYREPSSISTAGTQEGGANMGERGVIGKMITIFDVYEVTVTRNWYVRTWYYKDSAPTTEMVFKDTESTVLVDSYSRTR